MVRSMERPPPKKAPIEIIADWYDRTWSHHTNRPAWPFFTGDWRKNPHVRRMSDREYRQYHEALCDAWSGPLPAREVEQMEPAVRRRFVELSSGDYQHPKIMRQLAGLEYETWKKGKSPGKTEGKSPGKSPLSSPEISPGKAVGTVRSGKSPEISPGKIGGKSPGTPFPSPSPSPSSFPSPVGETRARDGQEEQTEMSRVFERLAEHPWLFRSHEKRRAMVFDLGLTETDLDEWDAWAHQHGRASAVSAMQSYRNPREVPEDSAREVGKRKNTRAAGDGGWQ